VSISTEEPASRGGRRTRMIQTNPVEEKTLPFLKWAGGKRWLTHLFDPLVADFGGTYFEPFVGSAAMFFHCRPGRAVLSDRNQALIEAYQAVREDYARVEELLRLHARKHSTNYYYELRSKRCLNRFTRAAQFIYLNRTCWNGLYRVNKQGAFNVPKGTKSSVLLETDDFASVSRVLRDTELLCSDFEAQVDKADRGDVVFVDPPYTVRHKHNGFLKYNEELFSWDDQVRLRNALLRAKARGARILLTNADHESIRSLYKKGFSIQEVGRYSAISGASDRRGTFPELLIA
jgi:DNA adenine methylase